MFSLHVENEQDIYLIKLGQKIARIRKEKQISQQDLSMDSDIPISQISAIENGKVNTTVKSLYRISRVLNVPISTFFEFDQIIQNPNQELQ